MPKHPSTIQSMFKHPIDRYPRLDTVLMIEEAIRESGGDYTTRQLWQKLPKKVMWQTYLTVLDYLDYSGKILIDPRDNHPVWIWDPEGVRKIKASGVTIH